MTQHSTAALVDAVVGAYDDPITPVIHPAAEARIEEIITDVAATGVLYFDENSDAGELVARHRVAVDPDNADSPQIAVNVNVGHGGPCTLAVRAELLCVDSRVGAALQVFMARLADRQHGQLKGWTIHLQIPRSATS